MKSTLVLTLLVLGFATGANAQWDKVDADKNYCKGSGEKLTDLCDASGNLFGICVSPKNGGYVAKVSSFSGVGFGYRTGQELLPTNDSAVYASVPASSLPPKLYGETKESVLNIIEDGKRAEFSYRSLLASTGTYTKFWTIELSACPADYFIPKNESFFP